MIVGSLGSIVFETSASNIVTPNSAKFSYSGRFEDHSVQGYYEQTEFLSPALGTVTLAMRLRRDFLRESPLTIVKKLLNMSREGEIVRLTLGKISYGKFTIRKIDYDWNHSLKDGAGPFSIDLAIELREYHD